MSKSNNLKNNVTKDTEKKQEKIVTKYDRKVERRKEQKKREEKEKKISKIVGIVLAAALVCFLASFPIRTFLTLNGTYITVDGKSINRVEYDYYYNLAMSNYLNGDGAWLQYVGINLSGDLSKQMYSDDMTWKDYFDEMAVKLIVQNKALAKEGHAAGFVHDISEQYTEYIESLRTQASAEGTTAKAYIRSLFGSYATESRLKPYVEEMMYASEYYSSVVEAMTFTQEEIQQYYDEHKNDYDLIDFRLANVNAELPTQPTELADPAATAVPADDTQSTYEPSEAEIAKAMETAKSEADKLEKTIKTDGEQTIGAAYSDVTYILREWLFSEERKAGDTTIIEDASYHSYYVLAFEKRERAASLSADVRVIMTSSGNGQEILDEWKNGNATEEGFAALCNKYNDPANGYAEGGLYEELMVSNLLDELKDWISDSSRANGDTAVISPEGDTYSYVIYYIAPNREEWIVSVENTLLANRASEYLDELADSLNVVDKKGNLNYLKVYAQREANGENQ